LNLSLPSSGISSACRGMELRASSSAIFSSEIELLALQENGKGTTSVVPKRPKSSDGFSR